MAAVRHVVTPFRVWKHAAIALAALACDGAAGPQDFGDAQIFVAPKFHSRPAPSIDLQAVTVRLTRLNGGPDSVIEVTRQLEAGRDTQQVDVTVTLREEREAFLLDLSVLDADGRSLFENGDADTVIATAMANDGSPGPPVQVSVEYVGPGADAAATKILTPTSPVRPGRVASLTAVASDSVGRAIPGALFEWEVADGPATIESVQSGDSSVAQLKADGVGDVTVRAYIPTLNPAHEVTVSLTIASNEAPAAVIIVPVAGETFTQDEPIAFQGAGTDSDDGPITGSGLRWESDVVGEMGTGASISRSDLPVGLHTITLYATDSEGATGTAAVTITVTDDPVIELSPSAATFSAVAGGSDPVAETVDVTNGGGAASVLDDLTVGTITYSGGAAGWLTATLDHAKAPALLTLQPATGNLAGGTYTASVPVISGRATNSPQIVTVTLDIIAPPTVRWSSTFDYASEAAGSFTVTAQLSTVTNQDVSVPFTVSGSATPGADYSLGTASPLVIPAGSLAAGVTVTLVDDALPEPSESVSLEVGSPVNALRGSPSIFTLFVTDDDAAVSATLSGIESCRAVIETGTDTATVRIWTWSDQGGAIGGASVQLFANGSGNSFGQSNLIADNTGQASTTFSATAAGQRIVEARISAGGNTVSVFDTLFVASAGKATQLVVVSGNNQNIPVGESGDPFVVRAVDAAGNPVSGVDVAWTFSNCFAATTDFNGENVAVLVSPFQTTPGGPFIIEARIVGASPVTFTYSYVSIFVANATGVVDSIPPRGGASRQR